MSSQTHGSPFAPLGSAQYVGAAAVIVLASTAPTDAGGFGKTLAQIETTLNATPDGSKQIKQVKSLRFSLEGGAAHILTTGQTPTAAIGIAYAAGSYQWENDAASITAFRAFLPVGVTLNVEYGA
jgi:hypothetical protein